MLTIACTGHRNIGGYTYPNPTYTRIHTRTHELLGELAPDKVITGMAIGFDQIVAVVCVRLGIPFVAALPFRDQDAIWPPKAKRAYSLLLKRAESVVIVSEGDYSAEKMMIRNRWMVDKADEVIACWNGEAKGGTYFTVQYAKKQNKPIHIINLQ